MASTAKRKTTMAKLNRERKLLERRMEKKVRKEARKRAAAEGTVEPVEASDADVLADTPGDLVTGRASTR
jgi:hypothetical protein